MIKRIWRGWTTPDNADTYQALLRAQVFPQIEAKNIPGHISIELLRRDQETESEFVVIMAFRSLQSVIDFQGDDYSRAYIPEEARKVLKRWDEYADHYEIKEHRKYDKSDG